MFADALDADFAAVEFVLGAETILKEERRARHQNRCRPWKNGEVFCDRYVGVVLIKPVATEHRKLRPVALAAWIAPPPQAVIAGYARPSEFVAHIDVHRAVQFIRHRYELHILSTLLGVKKWPADHEVRIRP